MKKRLCAMLVTLVMVLGMSTAVMAHPGVPINPPPEPGRPTSIIITPPCIEYSAYVAPEAVVLLDK